MSRLLPTGAALLMLIPAVSANAAHKHTTCYRQAPVQHLVPRPYGGVWQPRMLNPWICIGPCGQYSEQPPPFVTNPIIPDPPPPLPPPVNNN